MALLMNGAVTGAKMYDAKHHAHCSDMDDMTTVAFMQVIYLCSLLHCKKLLRKELGLAQERPITGWTPLFNSSFCSDRPPDSSQVPAICHKTFVALAHCKSSEAAVEIRRLSQGGIRRVSR